MDFDIVSSAKSAEFQNAAVHILIDKPFWELIKELAEKLNDGCAEENDDSDEVGSIKSSKLPWDATIKVLDELRKDMLENLKEDIQSDSVLVLQVFNQYTQKLAKNTKCILDGMATGRVSRYTGPERFLKSKSSVLASLEALEGLRKAVFKEVATSADFTPGAFPCSDWSKWDPVMRVHHFPRLKKYIEMSDMLGFDKAETNKVAMAAAIEQIMWMENVVQLKQSIESSNNDVPEQSLTWNTGFSAERIDEVLVAEYLEHDAAVFDVEINVNNVWKNGTLFFLGSTFEILVEDDGILVPGPRSALRIETLHRPSAAFILKYYDASYECMAFSPSVRDEIVLTVMAFMIKGPNISNISGQQILRFFPSMKKCSVGFAKLGTKTPDINKRSVEVAIELTTRRKNELEFGKCSETGFLDMKDVEAIADGLDEDHVFNVEICVDNVWKNATVYFPGNPFRIMIDGRILVCEPVPTALWVETHNEPLSPPQLIFQLPDTSCICRMQDTCLRDKIVVMVKAFMIKYFFRRPVKGWIKPSKGWIKLNVEAMYGVRMADGKDLWGIGGLIRDESGNWLKGFWGNSDKEGTMTNFELLSLQKGLELATEGDDAANLCVEIEIFSGYVAYVVLEGTPDHIKQHELAADCRRLLGMLGDYKLTAVVPESSRAAYKLAESGCQMSDEKSFLSSTKAPEDLKEIMLKESCLPS